LFFSRSGLPNVGKSSLANLLAGANHAEAANYPFCTIDPNVIQCIVPDKNFQYLVDVWKPPSVVPAVLKVTDIAGLIKGASEGAGLGNAFLSHIAAVDGIFHLIRAFESDEVIHVDDSVDPVRDMEVIQGELCAKDLAVLEGVIDKEKDRIRKEKGKARAADVDLPDAFQEAFDLCKRLLLSNTLIQTCDEFTATHVDLIRDWGLITTKPVIYVVNLSQKNFIRKGSKWLPKIKVWVDTHGGGQIIPVSVDFEENLQQFKDDPAAQKGTFQVSVLIVSGRQSTACILSEWSIAQRRTR
jgi:GTP-binding protein YchF